MSGTNPTDPLVSGGAPLPGGGASPGQLPLPGAPASGASHAPAPTGDPAPDDKEIKLSTTALNERLERAKTTERKTLLKSLGYETEEQARQAQQVAEQARQAQMTREQRLEEQLASERARAAAAEAARDEATFMARLTQLCAERGIKDVGYARYLVEQAAEGVDENTAFDAGTFLDGELNKPARRAAFGIDAPPTVVSAPANTTPVNPNLPPPAPGTAPNGGVKDAMAMTPAEWRAHEQKIHQQRSS